MKKKIVIGLIAIIVVIGSIIGILSIKGENNSRKSKNENSENNSEQILENDLIYKSEILSQDGEYIAMISKEGKQFRYEIEELTYVLSEDISIKIPQLKQGDIEGDDITFVNPLIHNAIINELETYASDGKITLDQYNYEVMLEGNQIISIVFTGNMNVENAAHPNNFILTVNVDLLTGNLLDTTNIIDNRDEFIKLLKSDKAEFEGVEDVEKYIKKELEEDVLKSEVFEISKKIYFTPEHICTVVSVPHAIGDYAVVKLKYSDLK